MILFWKSAIIRNGRFKIETKHLTQVRLVKLLKKFEHHFFFSRFEVVEKFSWSVHRKLQRESFHYGQLHRSFFFFPAILDYPIMDYLKIAIARHPWNIRNDWSLKSNFIEFKSSNRWLVCVFFNRLKLSHWFYPSENMSNWASCSNWLNPMVY